MRRKAPGQAVDLHAHFVMHRRLARRVCDSVLEVTGNRLLMRAANVIANNGAVAVRPTTARDGSVSFGSVLYHPADEVWGPCEPETNIKTMLAMVEEMLPKGWLTRTGAEFAGRVTAGENAVFHCIEGGYALGDPSNIREFARLGVAYVTLAHLRYQGVSANVNGLPFLNEHKNACLFPMPHAGLSDRGLACAEEMIKNGIIIDVTHMDAMGIDQTLAMAEAAGAPVIASHTASRALTSAEYLINLDDATIKRIARTGGVVGVIFSDHWLRPPDSKENTLALVVRTIRHIVDTAGVHVAAIGSDLDGFIQPVKELARLSSFPTLRRALMREFADEQIVSAIMRDNALRALKAGWGEKRVTPSRPTAPIRPSDVEGV